LASSLGQLFTVYSGAINKLNQLTDVDKSIRAKFLKYDKEAHYNFNNFNTIE
jgi:hypothetical protein